VGAERVEKMVPGMWCLKLANTVLRKAGVFEQEQLTNYAALLEWGQTQGLLDGEQVQHWKTFANANPQEARWVFDRALVIREALWRIFVALDQGKQPSPVDLASFTHELQHAQSHLGVIWDETGGLGWHWEGFADAADGILWEPVRSAGVLLTSEDRTRIHKCANPECSLLFFDSSRNRSRRWCAMNHCGSQLKARDYYHRKKQRS